MTCANHVYDMSALTHGHARSKLACLIYAKLAADLVTESGDKLEVIKRSLDWTRSFLESEEEDIEIRQEIDIYSRLWDFEEFCKLDEDEIKSSGYVVDTLEAAVWTLATTESYEECVLKAVNLGSDTDTVGAVAGGLAGDFYGYEAISEEWIKVIPKKDWIIGLCEYGEYCDAT